LVTLLCASALLARGAAAETLEEALVLAYQSNPALLAKRAELRATDEGVARARSGYRPDFVVQGDVGPSYSETESRTGTDSETRIPSSVSLSAVQPIYEGGRTPAEIAVAENLVQAGRADLQVTEQRVLLDGVTAYLDVLRDQSVVELNNSNVRVVGEQLEATRNRFEVGEVTRTDVAQAEARLSQANADKVLAEGNLIRSRSVYREAIGRLPGRLVWPEPALRIPASEAAALEFAAKANPAIINAEYNERAARDQINVARAGLLPQVQLRGQISRGYDRSSFFDEETDATIRAEVTVPLYQSGPEYAEVRRTKQVADQRRFELNVARRAVYDEVTRAWEALVTARAQRAAFEAQIDAAMAALDGVSQEAAVGLRTTLDVLDAEQELFAAQVNAVRARRDDYFAGYWLKSTVGELTAELLALPVEAYDATDYYRRVRDKWIGTEIGGQ
jgi:TolC family type I secretion outer membrane protein